MSDLAIRLPPSTIDINNFKLYTSFCKVVTKSIVLKYAQNQGKNYKLPRGKNLKYYRQEMGGINNPRFIKWEKAIWSTANLFI